MSLVDLHRCAQGPQISLSPLPFRVRSGRGVGLGRAVTTMLNLPLLFIKARTVRNLCNVVQDVHLDYCTNSPLKSYAEIDFDGNG